MFNEKALTESYVFCPECKRPIKKTAKRTTHCGTCDGEFLTSKSALPVLLQIMIKVTPPIFPFALRPGQVLNCVSENPSAIARRVGKPRYWSIYGDEIIGVMDWEAIKLYSPPPLFVSSEEALSYLADMGFQPIKERYHYVVSFDNGINFAVYLKGKTISVFVSFGRERERVELQLIWCQSFEQLRQLLHDYQATIPAGDALTPACLSNSGFKLIDSIIPLNDAYTYTYVYSLKTKELSIDSPIYYRGQYHCTIEFLDGYPMVNYSHSLGDYNPIFINNLSQFNTLWAVFTGCPKRSNCYGLSMD